MKNIYLLTVVLFLAACNGGSKNNTPADYVAEQNVSGLRMEKAITENIVAPSSQEYQQKIIKDSYLRFEVKDLDAAYERILVFVKANQGFVQNDNSTKSYNRLSRVLTIRIPTDNFQPMVDSIAIMASFFDEKRITLRDVTEEFIDLEARLKAKRTLEQRYLSLLSKAKTVEEMLQIERELSKIREEIEARQGRLKYLNDRVSLSTMQIEFYKVTVDSGITVSYGTKIWNAMKSGFNGLSMFFLGLIHIWPAILFLAVFGFILRRWIKKSRAKQ